MRLIIFLLSFTTMFSFVKPNNDLGKPNTTVEKGSEKASYHTWDVLLKKHVDNQGNVAYKEFKKDEALLDAYLAFLDDNRPTKKTTKNEKLAYYINLYNAATVKLILQNYPLKSIKDIKKPWDKKWVKVGGELLSLGDIEHKILRKMEEPRIHFAINCASFSCPKLSNTMFTANNMEAQLEEAAKNFINDTTRNKLSEKIALSKIFKWFKKDFVNNNTTILDYISKYTSTDINTEEKVIYLNYDWNLNEKK